ncbi:hypothetical protein [Mycobacterium sp. E1747]|uniref:hypothetical protein n=1 Tax=Mycobacterium sp. E1747 TaxID=1834128 RepID=UPI0009EEC757|nr:hypothetical protein [Mycobacterium sp. E1747]
MLADIHQSIAATRVDLREVGLREVLQSHGSVLETSEKVEIFNRLRDAGCREMNVVAFVNPNKMPQMADTEAFLRSLGEARAGTTLSGLVPNERGLDRALAMRQEGLLDTGLLVFSESSATLSANGMDANHDALIAKIERWAGTAADAGLKISVFVSASYGCSIEGPIDPARVVEHASHLRSLRGVNEVIISDSTGQADPLQVLDLLSRLAEHLPVDQRLGLHFHDTRGAGLANLFAALLSPFQHVVVDTAFGGWGGDWPFVPDAFGNVATEDVVEMLVGVGLDVGVDVGKIMELTAFYAERSGRPVAAKLTDAKPIAWKRLARSYR